jgi:hypothetical protein
MRGLPRTHGPSAPLLSDRLIVGTSLPVSRKPRSPHPGRDPHDVRPPVHFAADGRRQSVGDTAQGAHFLGPTCKLCTDDRVAVDQNDLLNP